MSWIDEDQRLFFNEHIKQVEKELCSIIEKESSRFPTLNRLVEKFRTAATRLRSEGLEALSQLFEVHNELCVAASILRDPTNGGCSTLEYESAMRKCEARFDFRAIFPSSPVRWFEIKTIHPRLQDDWEKYEKAVKEDRFSRNTRLVLDKQWMGGQLYHHAFSARSRILEYTLEMEDKIDSCLEHEQQEITFLVLFSNGFNWHPDQLEDFLFFYRSDSHYPRDVFGKMEDHFLTTKNITLKHNIHHFSYFRRSDTSILPEGGAWSIRPPKWPPL